MPCLLLWEASVVPWRACPAQGFVQCIMLSRHDVSTELWHQVQNGYFEINWYQILALVSQPIVDQWWWKWWTLKHPYSYHAWPFRTHPTGPSSPGSAWPTTDGLQWADAVSRNYYGWLDVEGQQPLQASQDHVRCEAAPIQKHDWNWEHGSICPSGYCVHINPAWCPEVCPNWMWCSSQAAVISNWHFLIFNAHIVFHPIKSFTSFGAVSQNSLTVTCRLKYVVIID